MTSSNFDHAIVPVLAHEGGFVSNPKDPGGPTCKGVTQRVYDPFRAANGQPAQSVALITADEAKAIYRGEYWAPAACDELPLGLDYAVLDYAVNSGVSQAIGDLQRTVGAAVDGRPGALTLAKVADAIAADGAGAVISRYCNRRLAFDKSLSTWSTFGKGWERRIMGAHPGVQDGDAGVLDIAVAMAIGAQAPASPSAVGAKAGEDPGKAYPWTEKL